jgi:(E)-4-hydroxy-3-methyl-but-2-enyl pyrophosphate reductase
MKVKVARTAGFCGGVRAAVNIALDASRDRPGPIFTLGPLVHNPQVTAMLETLGVRATREPPFEGTVVIRAHGITPEGKDELERLGLGLVDATCVKVAAVHRTVARRHEQGYLVVVLGDRGHAEVLGIAGHAGGEACVIEGPEEVAGLPDADEICLVAQTTQDPERFEAVAAAMRERYGASHLVIANTICHATRSRQEEVRRLAREVDAIVVVGGAESANTRRLKEVAESAGVPAFLVDSEADLPVAELARFHTVGLTAGASTPNWMIRRVHDALRPIGAPRSRAAAALAAINWLVLANLYVALGAAALTLTAGRILGFTPFYREYLISFLFVFAVHTVTLLASPRALALNVPGRARSFIRFRAGWMGASLAAALIALALEFSLRAGSGLLLVLLAAVSVLYPVRLIRGGRPAIRSLAEVPGSKDIFMALGWAALIVGVPLITHAPEWSAAPAALAALTMVAGLVLVRALLRDFRDIQADRLIGRETFPIVLGVPRTRRLLYLAILIIAAVMAGATLAGYVRSPLGLLLLIPLAYAAACVPLFTRQTIVSGFGAEAIIDAAFLLAGVVALISP